MAHDLRAVPRRKGEHLEMALDGSVESASRPGWDEVHLLHEALPELDEEQIDLSVRLLGRTLALPLVIAAMTGGHRDALAVNAVLARAAERHGIAIGVGSQRAGLLDPALEPTYAVVREQAPTALVIGNIGASQLIPQDGAGALPLDAVRRAIEMVRADALAIHLNVLEETIQPEGDRRTHGCAQAIRTLVEQLDVPVILKETGAGISRATAARIAALGVETVDVGGLGGTSFALIERMRAERQGDARGVALGDELAEWGIPTAVAIAWAAAEGLTVVGTGGVRSGLHAAKALALGATAVGVARPLLVAATEGDAEACAWIERFARSLRAVLLLTGARDVAALRRRPLVLTGRVRAWLDGVRTPPAVGDLAGRAT